MNGLYRRLRTVPATSRFRNAPLDGSGRVFAGRREHRPGGRHYAAGDGKANEADDIVRVFQQPEDEKRTRSRGQGMDDKK